MGLMKVSVLMPFKNTEEFLGECLRSLLAQSYEDWDLLAVDDHSTDKSTDIVRKFSELDNRILIFTNSGNGIIPALRLAYAESSGAFITRMDSDDVMAPDKLKNLVDQLHHSGPGHIAQGQVKYFSDLGISDGYARYERWLNKLIAEGTNFNEIYKECVIASPCWMVFRKDLDRCGAFQSNTYPEDYDLTFRFYKHGLKCIPCNKVLHFWRDYPTRTSRISEHYAQNYFLEIKISYFLELDKDHNRPLAVWGAGTKGKTIAKYLINRDIPFYWLCDNPKKIGKKIYGMELQPFRILESLKSPQSIVTVANEADQKEIGQYLRQLSLNGETDCFFFC